MHKIFACLVVAAGISFFASEADAQYYRGGFGPRSGISIGFSRGFNNFGYGRGFGVSVGRGFGYPINRGFYGGRYPYYSARPVYRAPVYRGGFYGGSFYRGGYRGCGY